MQPYFLPYIGYWQLLAAVDQFVVYDNIQYTKKGWINRNRFLRDGADHYFTVPLKKGSDFLTIAQRSVADDFAPQAMLNQLGGAYRKAPFFDAVFPVLESIVLAAPRNLFDYVFNSLVVTAAYLQIRTPLVVSSTVEIDHRLTAQDKVMAICRALGAGRYVNFIGGRDLYSPSAFAASGLDLKFIQSRPIVYPQFGAPFVPSLSILDVMMFNPRHEVRRLITECELV